MCVCVDFVWDYPDMPESHRARCPSCHPTNSIKALKAHGIYWYLLAVAENFFVYISEHVAERKLPINVCVDVFQLLRFILSLSYVMENGL